MSPMKSLQTPQSILILLSVIAISIAAPPKGEAKGKKPTIDDFEKYCGTYYPCGSNTAQRENVTMVTIARDKDALIIKGAKLWERCRFIVDRKGTLSDLGGESRIGTLVPGEVKFQDGQGKRRVLRADFCYDFFVFVGQK